MKNFVNPKKIKGQDKLDRIKDLMGKMSTLNESTSTSEVDNVKRGANGVIYGIVRENHSYFIKTTEKSSGTIFVLSQAGIELPSKIPTNILPASSLI